MRDRKRVETAKWTLLMIVSALALLAGSGCVTRAEHTATLATLEGPAMHVADEHAEFSRSIAGDSDGDGKITEADDFEAARAKLPSLRTSSIFARDAWLQARLRRHAELRGVFEDAKAPNPANGGP